MLFSPAVDPAISMVAPEGRTEILDQLTARFAAAFPEVSYEVATSVRLINAQALVLGGNRIVRLYGGLAFHPAMHEDGLALALLHETGHHLAKGARLPWDPLLACECRADAWALEHGIQRLDRGATRALRLDRAVSQLNSVFREVSIEPPAASGPCWARHWQTRRRVLKGRKAKTPSQCDLLREVLGEIR